MRSLRVSKLATRDIAALLADSEERFGAPAADAYRRLLDAAFHDLRADPLRPTVKRRADVSPELRFYHLRHSRAHSDGGRVSRPRHVIAFKDNGEQLVVIRVLHDAMDIGLRLRDAN